MKRSIFAFIVSAALLLVVSWPQLSSGQNRRRPVVGQRGFLAGVRRPGKRILQRRRIRRRLRYV